MNFDDKNEVFEAVLDMISREEKDVFSYYIKNDKVRDFVCLELRKKGLTSIDAQQHRHIYVDLKVDL